MSEVDFPKIEFPDKKDSWNLNSDSRYVLTAENVNEIKRVVNSLSGIFLKQLTFDEVHSYIRIRNPKQSD